MKAKLSLAAIVSTSAIASGVLLGSVNPAQACFFKARALQPSWLSTPLAAFIVLPGVALAVALSRGGRAYERRRV